MKRIVLSLASMTVGLLSVAPGAAQVGGAGAAGAEGAGDDPAGVLTPLETVRVERALEGRFACLGCHRVGGMGGAVGPSLDGLAQRVDLDYVVSMILDPAGTVPGTLMPRQPMPEREARRLARYLMTLEPDPTPPPAAPEAPPPLAPADSLDGPALYARHCAACHGPTGAGDGWNAGNLPVTPTEHADPTVMSPRPDDTLFDGIAAGGYVLDRSARMPAFGHMLSPNQIRALVEYIRVLCDCTEPAWASDGGGDA